MSVMWKFIKTFQENHYVVYEISTMKLYVRLSFQVKLKHMEFIMDVCILNMLKVGDLNTVFEQPLRATPVTVELVKKLFGYSYVSTLSILHAYLRIMEKYISEEKFAQARVLSSKLRFEFLVILILSCLKFVWFN